MVFLRTWSPQHGSGIDRPAHHPPEVVPGADLARGPAGVRGCAPPTPHLPEPPPAPTPPDSGRGAATPHGSGPCPPAAPASADPRVAPGARRALDDSRAFPTGRGRPGR